MDLSLTREPMVVNDLSSSDNDVIDDDDSDIVLDDIVIKKVRRDHLFCFGSRKTFSNKQHHQVPESSSDQLFGSMVAHSLPLLPSNSGDVRRRTTISVAVLLIFTNKNICSMNW